MDKLTSLRADHPTVQRRLSNLSIRLGEVELRTGTLRDEEYRIIDIVALRKDIVIRPMGSTVPEFVPAEIHAGALHTFANRPVVMNHPIDSAGNGVSANTPEILEASQFGHVFNPYYDDELGLILPAWLNDNLASSVGDEATSVITDLSSGVSREISVGVYAYIETLEGVAPDGTPFGAIWLDYDGDHLAILSAGDIGACSNSAGCGPIFEGATTMVDGNDNSNNDLKLSKWKHATLVTQASIRKLVSPVIHDAILNNEFSDRELRDKLWGALANDEGPSFDWYGWVREIYAKQGVVIYEALDGTGEDAKMATYQRGFKLSDGAVDLKNDRKEVIGFTPVLKDATATADNTPASQSTRKDNDMPKIAKGISALVGAIIDCAKCPFEEGDRAYLESKNADALGSIIKAFGGGGDSSPADTPAAAPANTPAAAPVPATATVPAVAPTAVPVTANATDANPAGASEYVQVPREQWNAVQTSLAEMKPAADAWHNSQRRERERLVTAIGAAGASVPKDEYSKWPLQALAGYLKDLTGGGNTSNDSDGGYVADFTLAAAGLPSASGTVRDKIPSGLAHLRKNRKNNGDQPAA